MKTVLQIEDQTCPQPPVIRTFATKQMAPLIKKDPRITSIQLRIHKLPGRSASDVYKIRATASGPCPTTRASVHSVSVRSALKSIRAKMNRRLIRQATARAHHSIGIQLKE
ncbi:hypothetical protein ACWPKS_12565 [Coraliomargarita sp. W4R72]